jgi:monolysocardiolipin acyltransferase
MDDPIIWGVLPLSYMFNPDNHRWGLGSYDLCFTNKCDHQDFKHRMH